MQAVVAEVVGGPLAVTELPAPRPGPGEVLVRMAAAPVNPSDLGLIDGRYAAPPRLPLVPGNEGSGVVVAAGRGLLARALLGRRVACAASPPHGGTWAQYMVTSASRCVPLRRSVDLEMGATLFVNPLSALGIMEVARRGRHRAIVSTAAASALGAMITRRARRAGLSVIAVVRREAQREVVLREGAGLALVSTSEDFDERLREAAAEHRATLLLDAVAGELTGRLLEAAPTGSTVLVYGALEARAIHADPRALFFGDRRIEGFYLPTWLRTKSLVGLARLVYQAQGLLDSDLATHVRERVDLDEAAAAIARYRGDMSSGKVLIVPSERVT